MRSKIFTHDELDFWNSRYKIWIADNRIFKQSTKNSQTTAHPIDKSFLLATPTKHVTITLEDIKWWKDYFYDVYSLVEVHYAISVLKNTYQPITVGNIEKLI